MITHDIPLPRLLNASGGTERRIVPISVSVNLTIKPLSYASMELAFGETLPARGYVELFTSMGSAGIFRVRSPRDAYGDDQSSAELEHAIVEVGDYILQAEYDEMKPASEAMTLVWSHYRGTWWRLGDVSAMGSAAIAMNFDHERVLDAMLNLLDQIPDCMLTFDFTTSPWTVAVAKRGTTVAAEGRLSRNVNSAKVTYDDSDLCTRAFYSVSEYTESETLNGSTQHTSQWFSMDADTLDKWGLVERVASNDGSATKEEAERVVREYLAKHKDPRISISISAEDLSVITGEPWDTFTMGKLFRLALPDYGTTVEQVVTGLAWDDVYGKPEAVTVNLAEEEDTAVNFIHEIDSTGGTTSGGGGRRKQAEGWKEFYTEFKKEDLYMRLVAKHVDTGDNILEQAGLYIDAGGVLIYADDNPNQLAAKLKVSAGEIRGEVEALGSDLRSIIIQTASSIRSEVSADNSTLYSVIEQTATHIRSEVANINSDLRSVITQTASAIKLEVSASNSRLYSTIEQTATSIRSEVANVDTNLKASIQTQANRIDLVVEGTGANAKIRPAQIIASINDGASTIKLSADHIDIDGVVDKLQTYTLESGGLTTGRIGCTNVTASDSIDAPYIQAGTFINDNYMEVAVSDIRINDNVMTIVYMDGTERTFSKATSLSGSWSGGTFTVTADTAINPVTTTLRALNGTGDVTVAGKWVSRDFIVQAGPDGDNLSSTGATLTASINASAVYDKGWAAAYSKLSLPATTNTSDTMTVKYPSITVDTAGTDVNYKVSADNSYAYIKRGSVTVAQISHSAYGNGWTAAYSKNSVPISAGTAASVTVKVPPSTVDGNALSYTYTLGVDVNSAYLKYGNTTVATKSHTLYTDGQAAGKAAVTLNDPTWNSVSSLTSNRTVTVTTNGRPTQLSKAKTIYLTSGSWSNGSIGIYIRDGSSSGTAVAQSSVSIPASSGTTWTNTTGRTWRADLTIGGVTRSSSTKDFGSYYTDGQDAAGLTLDTTEKKVKRSTSSAVKEYAVTTSASISYDATTGKYTATANTKLGSTEMGSDSVTGGTEAWWDGYKDGWHAYYDDAKWMKHDETGSEGYIWIPAREKTAWNSSGASQWAKWYAPDTGGGSVEVTHDIRCSSTVTSIGTDHGSRANAGAISKSGLTARSYLGFGIKCGNSTRYFYITVND